MEKRTISVLDFCAVMGISRNHGYKLVRDGVIPSIKLGNRIVIAKSTVEKILAGELQVV